MQRGEYNGGRPAPVPIFNHRKRQRQAVFADPGSMTGVPAPTPASNQYSHAPDLMPVGGFQGGRQQADFQKKTVRSGSYMPAPKQKYNGPPGENRDMPGSVGGRTATTTNSDHIQDNRSVSRNWGQQNMTATSGVSCGNRSRGNMGNSSNKNITQFSTNTPTQSFQHNQAQLVKSFNPKGQMIRSQQHTAGRTNSSSYSGGNCQQNRSDFNNRQRTSMYGSDNSTVNCQPAKTGYGSNSNSLQQNRGYQGNTSSSLQQNRGYQDSNRCPAQNEAFGFNNQNRWLQKSGYSHDRNNFGNPVPTRGYGASGSGYSAGTNSSHRGWGGAPPAGSPVPAGMPPATGEMFSKTASSGSQTRKLSKPSAKKDKPSLRVLTANLSTIVNSAYLSEQLGPHMFEVFGVLDSAVVSDKTMTGKEFVLRDETGSVQCVFYEIHEDHIGNTSWPMMDLFPSDRCAASYDRHLPRLIRGQWQRCVGTLERKTTRLKCVSVRAAWGEERHLAQVGDEETQKLLTSLRRQASEQ